MYKYTHLIRENTAPIGAKSIGIYNENGKRVGGFGLGRLSPSLSNADKLYSFLGIADVHITYETANTDFQRALTYAENSDCAFTLIDGDLTRNGSDTQMQQYQSIVYNYAKKKPVYAMGGNHESIWGYMTFDRLTPYTGKPLFYSFGINSDGNCADSDVSKTPKAYDESVKDVFIMVGYYGKYHSKSDNTEGREGWFSSEFVSVEELQWLYETLEANRNKRCFIFNHAFPYDDYVGDVDHLYGGGQWRTKDGGVGQAFINLLNHYKNTILFHGHSHLRFWLQERGKIANYSSSVGYRSVHIPSLSVPRDPINSTNPNDPYIYAESEGYIVDVFDNCIILNGRDFIDNDQDGNWIGIATYKIDTTLQTIEANTFTDNTGTIITRSDV